MRKGMQERQDNEALGGMRRRLQDGDEAEAGGRRRMQADDDA